MARIENITFACDDAERLSEFWLEALGANRWGLPPSCDEVLVERPGERANLLFAEQPNGTDRDLPIHLDLATGDREATIDRLVELGASVRETKTDTYDGDAVTWTVMEDPEGNGFCVSDH